MFLLELARLVMNENVFSAHHLSTSLECPRLWSLRFDFLCLVTFDRYYDAPFFLLRSFFLRTRFVLDTGRERERL